MEKNIKNINSETSSFVEALEAVVETQEKVLHSFMDVYGEGEETGKGRYMFEQTGLLEKFEEIRKELRDLISYSIESEIYDRIDPDGKED